jgi:hypothetical protein
MLCVVLEMTVGELAPFAVNQPLTASGALFPAVKYSQA